MGHPADTLHQVLSPSQDARPNRRQRRRENRYELDVLRCSRRGGIGAADVFVKMAAGKLPNSLGTLIYGAVAFGVGPTWFLADRARGGLEHASTAGDCLRLERGCCVQRRCGGSVWRLPGRSAVVGHLPAGPPFRPDRRQPLWRAHLERAGDPEVLAGPRCFHQPCRCPRLFPSLSVVSFREQSTAVVRARLGEPLQPRS